MARSCDDLQTCRHATLLDVSRYTAGLRCHGVVSACVESLAFSKRVRSPSDAAEGGGDLMENDNDDQTRSAVGRCDRSHAGDEYAAERGDGPLSLVRQLRWRTRRRRSELRPSRASNNVRRPAQAMAAFAFRIPGMSRTHRRRLIRRPYGDNDFSAASKKTELLLFPLCSGALTPVVHPALAT